MIAMHLSTFDSEREVKTAQEMLSYSSALLSTYELVVLFYLDSKEVKRIYTANDIPVYDREASIEESLRKFCEAQIEPVDQARYMKFMNFKTMTERVVASPKQFIQSVFRMRWKNGSSTWCTARVTQIPTFQEKVHMLTIQNIQGNVSQLAEAAGIFVIAGAEHGVFKVIGIAHDGLEGLLAKGNNGLGRIAHLQCGIGPPLAQHGHIGAGNNAAFGIHNTKGAVRNFF
jgi:hypothetical protein